MRKYFFLKAVIFFIAAFNFCDAQIVTVTFTDTVPLTQHILYLKGYKNGEWFLMDSVVINATAKENVKLNFGAYTGSGIIYLDKQPMDPLNFILNSSEKPIITTTVARLQKGKAQIAASKENLQFETLARMKMNFDADTRDLFRAKNKLSRTDSLFYTRLQAIIHQIEVRKQLFNDSVTALQSNQPPTFAMRITANLLKLPNRPGAQIGPTDFDNVEAFLFYHFFDFVPFNDSLLSNHYALGKVIESYFDTYMNDGDKTVLKSIDILLTRCKPGNPNYPTLLKIALDYMARRNYEYAVKYIYDTYSDNCLVDIDFTKHKELANIKNTQIGATIPDVALYDLQGKIRSLNNELKQKDYTLVYIWLSGCHACAKKTPELKKIVEGYSKSLQVFAISLDKEKADWSAAAEKYGIKNWINVSELVELAESTVAPKYNTRTTPKLFLVDKTGKIIAKDVFGEELMQLLNKTVK